MTWPVDPRCPPGPIVPIGFGRSMGYPVVSTEQPCAGCGKPIVPGSLYKPGKQPTHFGCRA